VATEMSRNRNSLKFGVKTLLKNKMLCFLPRIPNELPFRLHRSSVHAVLLLKANFYQSREVTIENLIILLLFLVLRRKNGKQERELSIWH